MPISPVLQRGESFDFFGSLFWAAPPPLDGSAARKRKRSGAPGPALKRATLEFGHFHCRVAASEGRPAFQDRSRQPNPIRRRGATGEMANLNGMRDSAPRYGAAFRRLHQG